MTTLTLAPWLSRFESLIGSPGMVIGLFRPFRYVLTKRDVLSESLQSKVFPSAGTATAWVLQNREWLVAGSGDEMRDRIPATARVMQEAGMQSLWELPLLSGVRVLGSLIFISSTKEGRLRASAALFFATGGQLGRCGLGHCLAHEEVRRLGNELSARTISELERQQRHMSDALQKARKALDDSEERQVIRVIDGPLAPISCVSQTAYERCSCPNEEHCGLRMLMLDLRSAIANILDRYTLADVFEVTLRKLRKSRMSLPFSSEQLVEESELRLKSVKKPKKANRQS